MPTSQAHMYQVVLWQGSLSVPAHCEGGVDLVSSTGPLGRQGSAFHTILVAHVVTRIDRGCLSSFSPVCVSRYMWLFLVFGFVFWSHGEFFHLCQGLLPGYIGMKLISPRSSLSPLALKRNEQSPFIMVGCCIVATTRSYKWNSCLAQLHLLGRG